MLNDLTILLNLLNLPLFSFYQSKASFLAFFLVTSTRLLLFTGLDITVSYLGAFQSVWALMSWETTKDAMNGSVDYSVHVYYQLNIEKIPAD